MCWIMLAQHEQWVTIRSRSRKRHKQLITSELVNARPTRASPGLPLVGKSRHQTEFI